MSAKLIHTGTIAGSDVLFLGAMDENPLLAIPSARTIDVQVKGTGAVTANVTVSASVDGDIYTDLLTSSLSGTNQANDRIDVNFSERYIKATINSISGTGAVVKAFVVL